MVTETTVKSQKSKVSSNEPTVNYYPVPASPPLRHICLRVLMKLTQ